MLFTGYANRRTLWSWRVAVLAWSQDRDLARLQEPTKDLVFVTDFYNHRVQCFRSDGTPLKQWGSLGTADGEFTHPSSVTALAGPQDRDHPSRNHVFVIDNYNHRIQVFDIDGSFICKWGSLGRADGEFAFPSSATVLVRSQDPINDLVYIVDTCNHRVQVFNREGLFLNKWGTCGTNNGQFKYPRGIEVHPTRDLVFISEFAGHRIQAFRSDGIFLFKWGSEGSEDGQFSFPRDLALHPIRELLFVTDYGNHRIQVFDLDGNFVCKWGSVGEFHDPSCIAVHPTNDVVYVCAHSRVQSFSLFQNVW